MDKRLQRYLLIVFAYGYVSVTTADQCQAKIQLTHYEPGICYHNFDHGECTDQCRTAMPAANPACFTDLSLPCDIRNDLFASAPGLQQQGNHTWVHISDLLNFPPLHSDLHIVRQDLYQSLYRDYISPPSLRGFSAASQQVKKENFRLLLISEVKALTAPLKEAAVFKRLSLGLALEPGVQDEFTDIVSRINDYPLFSAAEKSALIAELEQIRQSELMLWQFIRQSDTVLIGQSRVDYLNSQLEQLALNIDNLNGEKRAHTLAKIAATGSPLALNFRDCPAGICFDPIAAGGGDFYRGMDQILTHFESLLNPSLEESLLLANTVGDGAPPGPEPHPDFSGLMNSHIDAYRADPSRDNLQRLELAINVAFLQQDIDGLSLYSELKDSAVAEISGQVFYTPYEDRRVLLCRELSNIDKRLEEIQQEVFTVSAAAQDIIRLMIEQGHSEELLAQLQQLIARLQALSTESRQLSQVDRFSPDRHTTVLWNLDTQQQQLDPTSRDIRIEFIAIDGTYWIPAVSMPLQRLIPSIADIATIKGTLLPTGNGRMAALNTLSLALRQSPYNSCSAANQQIRIIVSVTDSSGAAKRYSLEAGLNQL